MSLYRITDVPLRCSLLAMSPSPRDPRDPHVAARADLDPPAELFKPGSGESASRARLAQRDERARALERMYRIDPVGFDRLFLELHLDDVELQHALRGKAYARGAILLRRGR